MKNISVMPISNSKINCTPKCSRPSFGAIAIRTMTSDCSLSEALTQPLWIQYVHLGEKSEHRLPKFMGI